MDVFFVVKLDKLLKELSCGGRFHTPWQSFDVALIQFQEQYEFVYKALLEALEAGETTIPSNEMETCYSRLKEGSDGPGKSKITEQFVVRPSNYFDSPDVAFETFKHFGIPLAHCGLVTSNGIRY